METKYIFFTGGVVSSVGKGVTAAAVGRLLKERGFKVAVQKLDPYINVDPGTMSPYQHGEVFVLDDGAETDLDLGHYERFIDIRLNHVCNITTGQVYAEVIQKERRGDYLGGTIQVIPHITNEIKRRIGLVAKTTGAEIVLVEVGGTVGDIESQPFLEAIRQLRGDLGRENTLYIHVTWLTYIGATGELKTLTNVYAASMVAMQAGADFIKTSTGKEDVNATLPVSLVMCRAIRDYRAARVEIVGFKPAGGIRSAKDAMNWLVLMKEELGLRWMQPDLFRFGASSMLADIERQLEHHVTGRYSAANRHPLA